MMTIIVDTLRPKTEKKLDAVACRNLKSVITEHIQDKPWEMEQLIWNLTFNSSECLNNLGFDSQSNAENVECIRAELAYRFREFNPCFNYGHRSSMETVAHKELNKALKGDQYTYDTVMRHIENSSKNYGKDDFNKLLYFLSSKKENLQFGGIRMLGFKENEAKYLMGMNATNQMGEVLKAILAAF